MMKPTFTFLILAIAALLPALDVVAQAPSGNQEVFIQLQHHWAEARKHADIEFLEKFYAKEFTVGLMNGGEASRSEDLSKFSSGDLKPAVIEDSDMTVHMYGSTAMVTGTEHLEGSYKGHTGQFDLTFTNVFVFRDGRWQIVRHQAAQIQKR
jgi:ketosteroid isomerase-like protein